MFCYPNTANCFFAQKPVKEHVTIGTIQKEPDGAGLRSPCRGEAALGRD